MKCIYRHGLVVMRMQPLHIGHQRIIRQMLAQCTQITVVLGSVQECGTERNPFSYDIRKQMLENCFDCKNINIMGLADINNPMEWANFVVNKVKDNFAEYGEPDVYYAGSEYDAHWFLQKIAHIEIIDRNSTEFPYVSATMVRDMLKMGDERWKNFVPQENWSLVASIFEQGKVSI